MDRIQKLLEAVDRWADYTIELRRRIHENPELSYQEFEAFPMWRAPSSPA